MKCIKFIFLFIAVLIIFILVVNNITNSPSFIVKKLYLDNKKSIKKLIFKINYANFIPLGEVIIENKGIEQIDEKRVYRLRAFAKPNRLFNFFLKIKIEANSFVDVNTFLPIKFTQDLQIEGKSPERKVIIYHQDAQFMEIEGERRVIYPPTYDPLSLFFLFLNKKNLKKGEVIDLNINSNQKNYRFIAKIEKSKEFYNKRMFWIKGEVKRRDGSPRHSSTFQMVMLSEPYLPISIRVFSGLGFFSIYLVSVR
jgi:hypothetical protein